MTRQIWKITYTNEGGVIESKERMIKLNGSLNTAKEN